MYRIKSSGEVKTQGEIRQMYLNTSFPKTWSNELVAELGLDVVFETPAPSTTVYQTAFKDGVEQVDGKWVWKWSINEMDDDAKAAKDAEAAKNVRTTRDAKLAETDWTALSDVTMSAEMTAYRQALRDVPAQAGFPHNVTWPSKPE
jgi:hypothetical protein